MGQSAVTQERLNAAMQKLIRAAERGEFDDREPTTPAQTGEPSGAPAASAVGGGEILQLVVSPKTLLKFAGSDTKELVISLSERD